MTAPLHDGKLVKQPIKENTAQWKPSVASLRNKIPASKMPNPKISMPQVNPLKMPDNSLAKRMKTPNPLSPSKQAK